MLPLTFPDIYSSKLNFSMNRYIPWVQVIQGKEYGLKHDRTFFSWWASNVSITGLLHPGADRDYRTSTVLDHC